MASWALHGRTTLATHRLASGDETGARRAITEAMAAQDDMGCLTWEAMLGGMGSEVMASIGDHAVAIRRYFKAKIRACDSNRSFVGHQERSS